MYSCVHCNTVLHLTGESDEHISRELQARAAAISQHGEGLFFGCRDWRDACLGFDCLVVGMNSRTELFFNHDMRVLRVIDLASLLATDAFEGRHLPEEFDDFENGKNIHESVKKIAGIIERHEDEPETVGEVLNNNGFTGLLMQVATPVRTFYGDGNGCRYSWGHFYTEFVYANSYEDALALGFEWAQSRKEHDKAKLKEEL